MGDVCICGCEIEHKYIQVDHVKPLRIGGSDELKNMLPACRSCNHYKATLDVEGLENILPEYTKDLLGTVSHIKWQKDSESYSTSVMK